MVSIGDIHLDSILDKHQQKANFLAGLFHELSIRPYFHENIPITWYLDEVASIKHYEDDDWVIPNICGTSPMQVIEKAYEIYVVQQPIIKSKSGPFQVTDDMNITFGHTPYQRPFKE